MWERKRRISGILEILVSIGAVNNDRAKDVLCIENGDEEEAANLLLESGAVTVEQFHQAREYQKRLKAKSGFQRAITQAEIADASYHSLDWDDSDSEDSIVSANPFYNTAEDG